MAFLESWIPLAIGLGRQMDTCEDSASARLTVKPLV